MTAVSPCFSSRLRSMLSPSVWLAASALAACSSSTDPTQLTGPGRAAEVVEYGQGDITVVFESGLGNDWTPWAAVATLVGRQARAFTYSRPGYGQSEPSPEPRDAPHIVEELRELLAARGAPPPYVLVGHSFGGGYMELFAKAYPEEVAGVVLVDPRHRDFAAACELRGLQGCSVPLELAASLPEVQQREIEGFTHTSERMSELGEFGAYPVRVLAATAHGFPPEVEALWASMLASLAGEAADGELQTFDLGHYLQLERVHEVAEVVLSLLPGNDG